MVGAGGRSDRQVTSVPLPVPGICQAPRPLLRTPSCPPLWRPEAQQRGLVTNLQPGLRARAASCTHVPDFPANRLESAVP